MPEISRAHAESELAKLHERLRQPAVCESLESGGANDLWREREFVLRHEGRLMRGTFDRVALRHEGSEVSWAVLLDFKTDHVPDDARLQEAVQRYAPQLAAYRHALARVLGTEEERVTARLVFLGSGHVIDLTETEVAR